MLGFAGHEHLFIGQDPLAIERHYRVLSHIDFHYGRCWPLDLALWDLAGKITGQPCWKLLGGLSNRVRAYASSGTLRDPGAMAEAAERLPRREGFRALKIRFHRGDWRDDVKALEAVRARVGTRPRADGRLQPGLAHALGHRDALDPQGRADGRPRARAARRLLDGGAAAPRRPRRHAGAARGDRRPHRRRRNDPRALRTSRSDHWRLPRCAAARRRPGRRHHRPTPRRDHSRRSTTSLSPRTPGPTAWA